jgi:SAM-dependent methyltransferase
MNKPETDKTFAGSIPKFYEEHLVPLIFEPYAGELANRLVSRKLTRKLTRVLEVAAGTGVVTRHLASALPKDVLIVATDLNQPMLDMAAEMGIEILDEEQYRELQNLGSFDLKTSSWIKTPDNIRKLGGALFCDFRYSTVFVYHNGADSYYAARGFRCVLKL